MTIDKLIVELLALRDVRGGNARVLLSGDPEGNDIRTIQDITLYKHNEDDKESEVVIWPTDDILFTFFD